MRLRYDWGHCWRTHCPIFVSRRAIISCRTKSCNMPTLSARITNYLFCLLDVFSIVPTSTIKTSKSSRTCIASRNCANFNQSLLNISVIKAPEICNIAVKSSVSIFGVALNWAETLLGNHITNESLIIFSFSPSMFAKWANRLRSAKYTSTDSPFFHCLYFEIHRKLKIYHKRKQFSVLTQFYQHLAFPLLLIDHTLRMRGHQETGESQLLNLSI